MIRCKECSYHTQSCKGYVETNFTSGRGPKPSDIMVIFDSPFIADIYSEAIATNKEYNDYLNKYLKLINTDIDSVYVTSFIKCIVADKNKKPTKPTKQKCFSLYLEKEILEVKPKVIFIIGRMITQWFIPDVTARVPLKQIIGQGFYNSVYNCHIVPVYDMFYLTNFTNKSSQVIQTEKSFALANTFLQSQQVQTDFKVNYSSDVSALNTLGNCVVCDVETTGLNPRKDIILTVALTDIQTGNTIAFDAEDYWAVEQCDYCGGVGQIKKVIQGKKDNRVEMVDCEFCKGIGKVLKENVKQTKFYTDILPRCVDTLKTRKIIFHNATFDLQMFLALGYDLTDNLITDTRMLQFLLNPLGATALGFLVQLYFGISYKDDINREKILSLDMESRRYYCARDTFYTAQVCKKLYPKIKSQKSETSNKVMTCILKIIAADLEYYGIYIDKNKAQEIITYYQAEKDKIELKFKKRFNLPDSFNLNSPKQLCKLLYDDLKLPVLVRTKTVDKKTGEKNPSTNEEAILKLAAKRPALQSLVDYREVKGHIEKLIGYLDAIDIDGRIHSSFNAFSPDSSRLMCSKPNIQCVPRQSRIKEIFVAKEGYSFIYYDYSAIEFRVWAALSKDKNAIKFITEGRDIHAFIASQFFRKPESYFLNKEDTIAREQRNQIKTCVYGNMYGRTPEGIVKEHGGSIEDAEKIQKIFFNLCREGWMWLKQIESRVFQDKKLSTPFGTIRIFPEIELAKEQERDKIIREAKSFIIQSWAVEMVFIGMYKVWKKIRELNLDAHYVHQIHDGLILEVKDEHINQIKELVLKYAQSPYDKLQVPLTVDLKVGKTWDEIA